MYPTPFPGTPSPVFALLVVAAVTAVSAGCSLPGSRSPVSEAEALAVLSDAADRAVSGDLSTLCQLSPAERSTCASTLEDLVSLRPDEPPVARCVVPAPGTGPLRGGQVVVAEGTDRAGDPYVTEFVVHDTGAGIGVLDAVWWSGLTIESYDERTVTWRFDSSSTACERGGLPVGPTEGASGS